jgi:peptide/nickel transport system substrate-binding protein
MLAVALVIGLAVGFVLAGPLSYNNKISTLESRVAELEEAPADLQAARAELDKAKETISSLEAEISSLEAEIDELKTPEPEPEPDEFEEWRKTLVVGFVSDVNCLDPGYNFAGDDAMMTSSIYDPLIWIDSDLDVHPWLATDWDISEDQTEYTFYLRNDVEFHDGTPFNAESVKFHFDRINELGGPSSGKVTLIDRVEVVDTYTVKFVMVEAFPPFFTNLGGVPVNSLMYVSPTAAEGKTTEIYQQNPVGTGPYKFVERIEGDRIVVEKNENFWGEEPSFDKIIYRFFQDTTTARLALEKGEVDCLNDVLMVIPPTEVVAMQNDPELNVCITPSLTGYTFMWFWVPDGPTSDPRIRQALSYATNRTAIKERILKGAASIPDGWVQPSMWSYEPVLDRYEYNPERAAELLAEVGYGPDNRLELIAGYLAPVSIRRDVWLMLQQEWAELGVDIEIKSYELGAWLETYETGANNVQISAWGTSYYDPHGQATWFLEASIPKPNNANYVSEEYEELAMQAVAETDQAKREEIYKQMWEILAEDIPAFPLWSSQGRFIYKDYLVGKPCPDPIYFRPHTLSKVGEPPT